MIFRQLASLLFLSALLVSYFSLGVIVVAQTFPNHHRSARVPVAKGIGTQKLFKQKCVRCHGVDGAGETTIGQIVGATDFTDSEWQRQVDDQRLLNSMTHGRGQMPSFGKKLSKAQIVALLTYVRTFKK